METFLSKALLSTCCVDSKCVSACAVICPSIDEEARYSIFSWTELVIHCIDWRAIGHFVAENEHSTVWRRMLQWLDPAVYPACYKRDVLECMWLTSYFRYFFFTAQCWWQRSVLFNPALSNASAGMVIWRGTACSSVPSFLTQMYFSSTYWVESNMYTFHLSMQY